MITVHDFEQRSPEWHQARLGMVTASMVGRLISIDPAPAESTDCPVCGAEPGQPCWSLAKKAQPTPIKVPHNLRVVAAATLPPIYSPSSSDTAKRTMATLVAERINGWSEPVFVNSDMQRGVLDEPAARKAYSEHFGVPVRQVGLMVRDDWGFSIGCSPDGLVGEDGGIECKSRRAANHLTTVLADEVPVENMAQIQCCLLVTGRKWWDYVSFSGGMRLWVKRIYPDPDWQRAIVEAVETFEMRAAEMIADYEAAVEGLPMTERSEYDMEIEVAA